LGAAGSGLDPRSIPRLLLQLVAPQDADDPSNAQGLEVLEALAKTLVQDFLEEAGAQALLQKLGRSKQRQQREGGRVGQMLLPSERGLIQALEYVMEQAVLLKLQLLATDPFMELVLLGK
jgi:hypothetical protein